MTIHELLGKVIADIGPVAKRDHNSAQNFSFRGIDSVVNAVGPVLRAHGVLMLPEAGEPTVDNYTTRNGAQMTHVLLPVTFTFYGPEGDSVSCRVIGEASDAGDKVMSKAHSVAWRIALLEVFAIPTDDPDPDVESHERAGDWWSDHGWSGQVQHDHARDECREATRALPEDAQAEIRAWLGDQGWTMPYDRGQMDAWRARIEQAS